MPRQVLGAGPRRTLPGHEVDVPVVDGIAGVLPPVGRLRHDVLALHLQLHRSGQVNVALGVLGAEARDLDAPQLLVVQRFDGVLAGDQVHRVAVVVDELHLVGVQVRVVGHRVGDLAAAGRFVVSAAPTPRPGLLLRSGRGSRSDLRRGRQRRRLGLWLRFRLRHRLELWLRLQLRQRHLRRNRGRRQRPRARLGLGRRQRPRAGTRLGTRLRTRLRRRPRPGVRVRCGRDLRRRTALRLGLRLRLWLRLRGWRGSGRPRRGRARWWCARWWCARGRCARWNHRGRRSTSSRRRRLGRGLRGRCLLLG